MQDWLHEIAEKFDSYFILENDLPRNSTGVFEVTKVPCLTMSNGRDVWRLWIGQGDFAGVDTTDIEWHAAEIGLAIISPPVERGNELVMVNFGTKTDWYDADYVMRWDNPSLRDFFLKLRATLSKRLKGPMWIADIDSGGIKPKPNRDVRYSAGAQKWLENGGVLVSEPGGTLKYLTRASLPEGFLNA